MRLKEEKARKVAEKKLQIAEKKKADSELYQLEALKGDDKLVQPNLQPKLTQETISAIKEETRKEPVMEYEMAMTAP